jgi:hypothetical protein
MTWDDGPENNKSTRFVSHEKGWDWKIFQINPMAGTLGFGSSTGDDGFFGTPVSGLQPQNHYGHVG